ncbi:hypothetical protein [Nioella sp. MMSF_3534]|uniref:hypothetical protein n=1 Tax=Nioella sp. MMSF_3534 TaxID=3046720 RepID=UPI00273EDCBC|nr:hypothetical protein [Nioella sp. MMSF_3534]
MFARISLCALLCLSVPAAAQDQGPDAELVDALFDAAGFQANLASLRGAALSEWQGTGGGLYPEAIPAAWTDAMEAATDPAQIAADFRRGFVTVPFSPEDMETAIAALQTPFGQRLTEIGQTISTRLAEAENLQGAFAGAELTNDPRVIAADRVLDLRGSIETHFTFLRASEQAYYLGLNDAPLNQTELPASVSADLNAYMADWETYFDDIQDDVTLSYRQMFFLVTDGFTSDEVDEWVTRAEQPWAQAFEDAFQAGYREAYRQSMYRLGQAVAAGHAPAEDDGG